jgi:hypothetical protein
LPKARCKTYSTSSSQSRATVLGLRANRIGYAGAQEEPEPPTSAPTSSAPTSTVAASSIRAQAEGRARIWGRQAERSEAGGGNKDDWLGNTDNTDDDAQGFYDRSLGTIGNGTTADADGPYQLATATQSGSRGGTLTTEYDVTGRRGRVTHAMSASVEDLLLTA